MAFVDTPSPSLSSSKYSQDGVTISTIPPIIEISSDASSSSSTSPSNDNLSVVAKVSPSQVNISIIDVEKQVPLPAKRYNKILRHARYTFLNVYRRLFSIVFVVNMVFVVFFMIQHRESYSSPQLLANLAAAASANVMVALLIRQDYVVNGLFR